MPGFLSMLIVGVWTAFCDLFGRKEKPKASAVQSSTNEETAGDASRDREE